MNATNAAYAKFLCKSVRYLFLFDKKLAYANKKILKIIVTCDIFRIFHIPFLKDRNTWKQLF